MSIAVTDRAVLAIGRVNQASPEHRSMMSMPGAIPTAVTTAPGSGHNARHQPATGISVPGKNPGRWSATNDARGDDRTHRRRLSHGLTARREMLFTPNF